MANWKCVIGWCLSFAAFIGIIAGAGGPAVGDAWESIYATWAVAHGQFACMYPPHPVTISAFAAPVYPVVVGAVTALAQVGHGVPFPSGTALGHGCTHAIPAMIHWSERAGAIVPTLRTGYLSWLVLMAGLIWLLRASGRGRSGWEPTTLLVVACLPPVWLSVEMYFHPQDLVAMGFGLAATACALRTQWVTAGVLIAVAAFTNQFTLLMAIPLLVVAPSRERWRYVIAAAATAGVIAGPILALSKGTAAHYVFYGSGNSSGIGGTVIWETNLHGFALLLVSRILPLVLSFLLSIYVVRRVGAPAARGPAVLVALLALSLSLRLVFEQNIFSYYYLALSVILVVLDVLRGRIRETLVAWLAMVTLVYTEPYIFVWRQFWDQDARHWVPVVVMVAALLLILRSVLRHRIGWNVLMWAMAVVTALVMWPVSSDPLYHLPVTWFWQALLVGIGVALAAGPLWTLLRQHAEQPSSLHQAETVPSLS